MGAAQVLADAGVTSGETVVAVVAGGLITLLTATVGQLLAERYRRRAEQGATSRDRAQHRRDRERELLDELLAAEQTLEAALGRDRAVDLEQAHDPQARHIREADSRFRGLVPQVADERVRRLALQWRDLARAYAATRPGDRGGPRLHDVDAAQDVLNEAVGEVKRRLNAAG